MGELLDVLDEDRSEALDPGTLTVLVCLIRKKLAGCISIKTYWKKGYVMEALWERG